MIRIEATGLNFKDVLIGLGQLPWQGLGRECSGVVTQVGPELESHYKVGGRVLHWGMNLFASHARCRLETLAKAPAHLGFAEAAAVPVVYSTAFECLVNVARLKKRETVLIHAAAGGVGQAAVMLAQWIGAEIYCTVGTAEKRELLVSRYGIPDDHIFSSRNTNFATSLLHLTKSKGVDVILNSLSDEMFRSTWSCVAIFGRFVDIGKKHFVNNAMLELSPFDKSVTYASVDLSLLIEHRGQYVQELMSDVVNLFNDGVLQPPMPVHKVPITDVQAAFRSMQSGKMMGKLVVVNESSSIVTAPMHVIRSSIVRSDASYLITGGTGGLDRALAKWLIDMGARHVILVSRSGGDSTPGSPLDQTITWANEHGARVHTAACDVSDVLQLESLLRELEAQSLPPVAGVIHGAMVLKVSNDTINLDFTELHGTTLIPFPQDSLFEKATFSDWAAVLNPKVHGALNLHSALSNHALDFFICLSSIVAISGNLGQSSYAGSNALLDAFCQSRNRQGLPATAINLPAINEVGYVAEAIAAGKGKAMESYYTAAISQSQLRLVLEATTSVASTPDNRITDGQVVVGLSTLPERTQVYAGAGPLLNLVYREAEAIANEAPTSREPNSASKTSLKHALHGLDLTQDTTRQILYGGIADKISSILMVPREDVKTDLPLVDLGLDSLVAVELRNWLVRELGITISVIDIADSKSAIDLSDKVAARMVT